MVGQLTLQQTLRTHAFVRGLPDRHIATLAALATEVTFAENEAILMDRQESQYFYLVTSGSVNIELHTSIFTVSVLAVGPGQAFGWSALLDHQDTVFQVRAREQTSALCLPGPELAQACRNDCDLGVEILFRTLQVVAGRIQATEARFAEICGVRIKSSAKKEHSLI
jgi:CRP-like cAMP-binding protein